MDLKKDKLTFLCLEAMQLLISRNAYTQADIVGKLNYLSYPVSTASFNNIMRNKGAGLKMLALVAQGLQIIVKDELGMEWADGHFIKTVDAAFQPNIIPTAAEKLRREGYVQVENARLPLNKKVAFFKDARQEVIEFGVTLSRFSSNLTSGNKEEFRVHVEELLSRGIHFRCFLLRADFPLAWAYFDDRHKIHPEENQFQRKIAEATDRLRSLQAEFATAGYAGKFEVFEYEHVPYNYFMSVDGSASYGKLMVSPYLYAIRRSATPVFIINRKDTPVLHQTYWDSFNSLIKNARRIIPA